MLNDMKAEAIPEMKKLLAVLIVLLMIFACCACSNGNKPSTSDASETAGAADTADTAETAGTVSRPQLPVVTAAAVGDIVIFGRYEQDNNLGNGSEPIEWIVLDTEGSKALLLSKFGLDATRYNQDDADVTWETCTLRTWLNGEFAGNAFSREEQSAIMITEVDNSSGQGSAEWTTPGGNNTQDRIFLLSCSEADRYLGVPRRGESKKSRVSPTAYAIARGTFANEVGFKTEEGALSGVWWLRSPGRNPQCAAYVYEDGSLGDCLVGLGGELCARPALWLDISAGVAFSSGESSGSDSPEAAGDVSGPKSIDDPSLAVGDTVAFGRYEQDNNLNDGFEPIEWTVLDMQDGKALLISRFGLAPERYNESRSDVTWENCSLRSWLNRVFVNQAFWPEEYSAILTTEVDNGNSQRYKKWNTTGGNNTYDKVFLLSYAEVHRYMDVTYKEAGFSDNMKARVAPTESAREAGTYTDYYNRTEDDLAAACWWLRSPGPYVYYAAHVYYDGGLFYSYVDNGRVAVRPAIWVSLNPGK